jgi:hypothetical protein
MENSKILVTKLVLVLIAAFVGALIFDGIIILAGLLYDARYDAPWVQGFFWCLMLPGRIVSGFTGRWPNQYVLYSILGAASFGSVAALWQFLLLNRKNQ